jgi:hypothetical protein
LTLLVSFDMKLGLVWHGSHPQTVWQRSPNHRHHRTSVRQAVSLRSPKVCPE